MCPAQIAVRLTFLKIIHQHPLQMRFSAKWIAVRRVWVCSCRMPTGCAIHMRPDRLKSCTRLRTADHFVSDIEQPAAFRSNIPAVTLRIKCGAYRVRTHILRADHRSSFTGQHNIAQRMCAPPATADGSQQQHSQQQQHVKPLSVYYSFNRFGWQTWSSTTRRVCACMCACSDNNDDDTDDATPRRLSESLTRCSTAYYSEHLFFITTNECFNNNSEGCTARSETCVPDDGGTTDDFRWGTPLARWMCS